MGGRGGRVGIPVRYDLSLSCQSAWQVQVQAWTWIFAHEGEKVSIWTGNLVPHAQHHHPHWPHHPHYHFHPNRLGGRRPSWTGWFREAFAGAAIFLRHTSSNKWPAFSETHKSQNIWPAFLTNILFSISFLETNILSSIFQLKYDLHHSIITNNLF